MPFLDELAIQPDAATVNAPEMQGTVQAPNVPTWGQTFGAAFGPAGYNTVGSFLTSKAIGVDNSVSDAKYSAWDDIKGTKYQPYWNSFASSNNPTYTRALMAQLDQQDSARQTLAASGWRGALAGTAAGILDIPTLIPIGGELAAGGKGAYALLTGSLRTGASFAGVRAMQEAALHQSQVGRTLKESAQNVAASGLMGGAMGLGAGRGLAAGMGVGAGVGAVQSAIDAASNPNHTAGDTAVIVGSDIALGALLGRGARSMSPEEHAAADTAFRNIHANEGTPTVDQMSAPQSASAAVAPKLTNADLSVSGNAASAVADATKALNPNLRSNFRAVPEAREIAQQLAENTLYQNLHDRGESVGPAAETLMRANYDSRTADAFQTHDDIYRSMKKDGVNLSQDDFSNRVGEAMRNNDTDPQGNQYVTQAAKAWRQRVYDPFKQEAIENGLLPPDVDVTTSDSYFNRVWNPDKLIQQEDLFKNVVQQHYEGKLSAEYGQDRDRLNGRLSNFDQQIGDLQAQPDERVALREQIKNQADQLDQQSADMVDLHNQIKDLREQASEAYQSGDASKAQALNEQAKQMTAQGGTRLQDYRSQSATLRQRMRNVESSAGALQTKGDKVIEQMAKLEEANQRSLQRLVSQGQRLQKEIGRLDPARREAALADLRTRVNATIEKMEQGTEKFNERAAKTQGEGDAAEMQGKLEAHNASQQRLIDSLHRLSDRLEQTENFDPVATLQEVHDRVQEVLGDVSRLSLAKGERMARLNERLKNADPAAALDRQKALEGQKAELTKRFYDKWERDRLVSRADHTKSDMPDFSEAARDIADSVHTHLVGPRTYDDAFSEFHVPITRGPLKDRTFLIPDQIVKPWLNSDIRYAGPRYARTMAAENELASRFGRADMRDQLSTISRSYGDLREKVGQAQSAEEVQKLIGKNPGALDSFKAWMRGQGKDRSAKELALDYLHHDEKGALTDIQGMRDLIRGTYKQDANSGNYARVVRATMQFNYMRQLGNFLVGNLQMMYRPAMVHGLTPFFRDGIAPLMANLGKIVRGEANGFSAAVGELKLAGVGTGRYLHGHLSSLAEIGDPYGKGTALERLLQNGTQVASRWNGMSAFFDFMRSISGNMTQHRIIDGALKGKDARYLAYLGIDKDMAGSIAQQYEKYGMQIDGMHVANTGFWDNYAAVRAYRAAVNKDVAAMIHQKSVGDVPLSLNTPTGRLLSQFRTFNLAAHQRVMLRGLQESPANFVSGLVAMSTMGAAAAYLTALRGGKDQFQRFEDEVKANPMHLVAEGLDKSGLFTLPFEAANNIEKLTSGMGRKFTFNPIKTPLEKLGGVASSGSTENAYGMNGNNSNTPADWLPAVMGPTGNLLQNLPLAAGATVNAARGRPVSKAQKKAAAATVPFSAHFGMREAVQVLYGNSPYIGR